MLSLLSYKKIHQQGKYFLAGVSWRNKILFLAQKILSHHRRNKASLLVTKIQGFRRLLEKFFSIKLLITILTSLKF